MKEKNIYKRELVYCTDARGKRVDEHEEEGEDERGIIRRCTS